VKIGKWSLQDFAEGETLEERKMKKFIAVTGAVFLVASPPACKNTKKQAIDYNNKIVDQQSRIVKSMLDFSKTFDSKDTELMEKKHKELLDVIGAVITETKGLAPFEGSAGFKDAALKLFEFYRDISKKEYKEMIEIFKKEQITQADVDRIDELNDDISAREKVLDDEFQKIQEKFAEQYGIPLQENALQGEIDNL
jgi:hypothetical protein